MGMLRYEISRRKYFFTSILGTFLFELRGTSGGRCWKGFSPEDEPVCAVNITNIAQWFASERRYNGTDFLFMRLHPSSGMRKEARVCSDEETTQEEEQVKNVHLGAELSVKMIKFTVRIDYIYALLCLSWNGTSVNLTLDNTAVDRTGNLTFLKTNETCDYFQGVAFRPLSDFSVSCVANVSNALFRTTVNISVLDVTNAPATYSGKPTTTVANGNTAADFSNFTTAYDSTKAIDDASLLTYPKSVTASCIHLQEVSNTTYSFPCSCVALGGNAAKIGLVLTSRFTGTVQGPSPLHMGFSPTRSLNSKPLTCLSFVNGVDTGVSSIYTLKVAFGPTKLILTTDGGIFNNGVYTIIKGINQAIACMTDSTNPSPKIEWEGTRRPHSVKSVPGEHGGKVYISVMVVNNTKDILGSLIVCKVTNPRTDFFETKAVKLRGILPSGLQSDKPDQGARLRDFIPYIVGGLAFLLGVLVALIASAIALSRQRRSMRSLRPYQETRHRSPELSASTYSMASRRHQRRKYYYSDDSSTTGNSGWTY